jgi:hypothetical protein
VPPADRVLSACARFANIHLGAMPSISTLRHHSQRSISMQDAGINESTRVLVGALSQRLLEEAERRGECAVNVVVQVDGMLIKVRLRPLAPSPHQHTASHRACTDSVRVPPLPQSGLVHSAGSVVGAVSGPISAGEVEAGALQSVTTADLAQEVLVLIVATLGGTAQSTRTPVAYQFLNKTGKTEVEKATFRQTIDLLQTSSKCMLVSVAFEPTCPRFPKVTVAA